MHGCVNQRDKPGVSIAGAWKRRSVQASIRACILMDWGVIPHLVINFVLATLLGAVQFGAMVLCIRATLVEYLVLGRYMVINEEQIRMLFLPVR